MCNPVSRLIDTMVFHQHQEFIDDFRKDILPRNKTIILESIRGVEIAKIDDLIVKENDGYADALCMKDKNGMQAAFNVCFDQKFDIQMKKKNDYIRSFRRQL